MELYYFYCPTSLNYIDADHLIEPFPKEYIRCTTQIDVYIKSKLMSRKLGCSVSTMPAFMIVRDITSVVIAFDSYNERVRVQ